MDTEFDAPSNRDELPPDAIITLSRIGSTDHFYVMVNGKKIPEILDRGSDLFGKISHNLHVARTRKELDERRL